MKKDEPIEKHHEFTNCCREIVIRFQFSEDSSGGIRELNDCGVTDTFYKLRPSCV